MLSRVAQRVYWTSRYIERAENTARLVSVYTSLILDLPHSEFLGWRLLLFITGSQEAFAERYQNADARNTTKFLLADDWNPGSVVSSVAHARENVRTTRDIVPSEAWQEVNELYLYAKEHAGQGVSARGRHRFLREIITRCQQLTGLLAGAMSHDAAYDFIRLGRNLERADMTSRILDVAGAIFRQQPLELAPYVNILWVNILRSLSAYQAYRQNVKNRVQGGDVLAFLLQDSRFPRAVGFCLDQLAEGLQRLPRGEVPLRSVARLQRHVSEAKVSALLKRGLHEYIDELQQELGLVHQQINVSWFALEQSQTQTQAH